MTSALCAVALALGGILPASAADWPMWRYDEARRGVSPAGLSDDLHLHWVLELPEPRRAWHAQHDDGDKLEFDVSYEPVVMGTTVYVASMSTDSLTAYDTRTGERKWRFYANAPMRFAPVAWEGRVYAGADDGHLYCLDAESGEPVWTFTATPRERWLLGNERFINNWPVRGGPVMRDGILYFTAGVWPFMGTFIYALDARNGEVIWLNSGTGSMFNLHQHGGAFSFGGVAPQGYIAATEDKLLIPGGRTPPAAYDRHTGDLLYFRQATDMVGKGAGGYAVWAQGGWFFNHGLMYALQDGAQFRGVDAAVVSDDHLAGLEAGALVGYAPEPDVEEVEITNRLGRGAIRERYSLQELFRAELDVPLSRVHIQAGDRLYAAGQDGLVAAVDLPAEGREAGVSWQATVDGEPWSMIAADDRLFVVTRQGAIYCFGPGETQPSTHALQPADLVAPADGWDAKAADLLERSNARNGYAVAWGVGSGRLVEEIITQSDLHVVVVEPDAATAKEFRDRMDAAGLYGSRVHVIQGSPTSLALAPYFAQLVVSENPASLGIGVGVMGSATERGRRLAERALSPLRPYGGLAWLQLSARRQDALAAHLEGADLPGVRMERGDSAVTLTRPGPLPGAGTWTHQYADSANTGFSPDQPARAPLAVLWFGGSNNHNALPRHMNGPVPQVVGGRLFFLGPDTLTARDVYTGRDLWVQDMPGIGHPFTSLEHEEQWAAGRAVYFPNHPGANFIGSPYVSVTDSVYVMYNNRCLRLDPATGERLAEFTLQAPEGDGESGWGHMVVWEDLLIAGADPQMFDDTPIGREESWNATSSERIVAMNRYTGEVLWTREATYGFRHNAIIAAAGKVFALDGLSERALELMQRRGVEWEGDMRVMAFNARTGEVLWSDSSETFGTWLSYSTDHDVLLQAGRHGARRPLPDEPRNRMVAHRGATGEMLWERSQRYSGPVAMRHDSIITGRGEPAIDLLTGRNVMWTHPVTGMEIPWSFTRTYGCGTQNVSENLITFRSGAAGFYDLHRDGGTGNFGGFRAGCTNNLVAADGILNAPEYTRSCTCSYQLQTSLALVHDPSVEMWTYASFQRGAGPLLRTGLNFGAPGSRLSDAETWWVEYPEAGGSALKLPLEVTELDAAQWGSRAASWKPTPFLHHSTWVQEQRDSMEWVAASGLEGAGTITVQTLPEDVEEATEGVYTLRLHFVEPGDAAPAERVFGVHVQGRQVLSRLDVVRESGGPRRGLVREVHGVPVGRELQIELIPTEASEYPPVLCGVELVLEESAPAAAQTGPGAIRWAAAPPAPAPPGRGLLSRLSDLWGALLG